MYNIERDLHASLEQAKALGFMLNSIFGPLKPKEVSKLEGGKISKEVKKDVQTPNRDI
jgi:hypothetical protein